MLKCESRTSLNGIQVTYKVTSDIYKWQPGFVLFCSHYVNYG